MSFFRELLIKIKGDTKDFQGKTKQIEQQTGKLEKGFNKLGAAMAAVFSVGVIVNFIKKSITAYDEQIKAEASLTAALGGREDMMKRIASTASDLQKRTLFGDEKTTQSASRLAQNIGANEKAIKQLLPLVADFATAKGMDMATTADLVGKTLASSTNLLSRYGLQIEGAVGSTERLENVTNALTKAFGGQAEAAARVGTGPLQQLKNAIDDTMEEVGKAIVESDAWTNSITFLNKALKNLDGVVRGLGKVGGVYIDPESKAKKQIDELRDSINGLDKETARGEVVKYLIDLKNKQADLAKKIEETDPKIGLLRRTLTVLTKEQREAIGLTAAYREEYSALGIVIRDITKNFDGFISASQGDGGSGINVLPETLADLRAELTLLKENKEFLPVSATNQIAQVNDQIQELESRIKDLDELSILRKDLSLGPLEAIPLAMLAIKDATDQATESMDKWVAGWTENAMPEIEAVIQNFDHMLQDFLTDSVATFAEGIGTALSGQGSFEDGLNSLLMMVADWAGNFGKLLIAAGFAASSFQKTLATNPPLAIAAGAALVAAAALVKGALSQNPMKGKGASTGGGGSRRDSGDFLEGFRQLTPDLRVTVDGRIVASGSQLAVVLENETRRRNF